MILASTRLITLRHFPRPLIGMEQFLCFFTEGAAEKFRIEGFDLRIAMTEAQGHFLVKGIETLTARFGSLFIIGKSAGHHRRCSRRGRPSLPRSHNGLFLL